jgi:hypothetical protein
MDRNMQDRGQLALVGAAAGGSLYALAEILDGDLLGERLALALAAFTASFFFGVLGMAGPLRIDRAAIRAAGLAMIVAGLISLAGQRFDTIDELANSPVPGTAVFVLTTIPLPFLIAAAGPGWRDYPCLFTHAWGIFVRYSLAWAFVGVVWGVILLSDALFGVVGLTVIEDLLDIDIVPWLITGTVLGLALAVVQELADVVTPYLVLRLLRLLVPVVLVVLAVFVLALPMRGLSGLFGGLSVAATLLAMTAAAATLITSAVDQDDLGATEPVVMRRATQALALIPADVRPVVLHQSGAAQIEALRANYAAAGVQAELTPFIDDTARAFAEADVIVCRAGASTVTEIAAVGAAAIYVPFPSAVDDHQTTNARFLVDAGGGWLMQQSALTAQSLAEMLQNMQRATLLERAGKAKKMQKTDATAEVVAACEELAA